MRPGKVVENLPEFANSLAAVSYIDLGEARKSEMKVWGRQNTPQEYFNGQAVMGINFETGETFGVQHNIVLSDLEQLRYAEGPPGGEVLVADASTSIASMRRDDIRLSLGALGRIVEYVGRLGGKESRAIGQATKVLGTIVVKECFKNLEDDDIAARVDDYEALLPLLKQARRRIIVTKLAGSSIQDSRHLGEVVHIPRSSWVTHKECSSIVDKAELDGLGSAVDECYPAPGKVREYIASIDPLHPPTDDEFLDKLRYLVAQGE